ncbi:MAG TPA: heparan-alpha-glucosaminide N-acetyltransferase domain-containing protein [Flavilitoribacter sp.]|nr:heparan-alpha-glucosaminide N-acetyltransferase domain-containing protein [Flavilitoribacter sp.]
MKSTATPNGTGRIQSVDVLRGLIMILMAIDHVRVYSGIPAGSPDPGIFFTRWITHFCAPGFAFLAGTSAFLYGAKIGDTAKLARFLVTRGIFLVVLEITVIRFLWAFHINFSEFFLAGVIWMLGWCMVLLAALVRLKPKVVGWIGLGIIFLQQLFSYVPLIVPESGRAAFGKIWEFVYPAGLETFSSVSVLYVLVPWIGVMAAGYGFGVILQMDAEKQRKIKFGLSPYLQPHSAE